MYNEAAIKMRFKPKNIHYHYHAISRGSKEAGNGHKGCVVWLTGLPGSGKSTVADLLGKELFRMGCVSTILDGDNVRHGLNSDLGFSGKDREENIRRIAEVAKLLAENGQIAIAALISPFRKSRDAARARMREGDFIEIYLECDPAVCAKRDPKGLYKKAKAGKIARFTGVSSPYEEPLKPEIKLDTSSMTPRKCAETIIEYLAGHGYIKG